MRATAAALPYGTGSAEVRFAAATHILQGDRDGNGRADFWIELHGAAPVAGDFVF